MKFDIKISIVYVFQEQALEGNVSFTKIYKLLLREYKDQKLGSSRFSLRNLWHHFRCFNP